MPFVTRLPWLSTIPLACSAPALAQAELRAQPLPSPLRDAGVYHVATGTWSRAQTRASFGPKTLYANTANTGLYGFHQTPGVDVLWTDEGRVPSTTGHPNATSDTYTVNGFELAYCSNEPSGAQHGAIVFYECYASCTDPSALPALLTSAFTVPGGSPAGTLCWLVAFDLTGSTQEFAIRADCDGVFDGTSALDDFGWTLFLDDIQGNGLNGPLLNGDPNNFAYGDGTYYQSPGASQATGLGTADRYWMTDTTGTFGNGCYWFGGYSSSNPFASFWLRLYGDDACADCCGKYCTANANSTGVPADLTLTGTSAALGDVTATAAPVPNQPGIFFHGSHPTLVPFGNGFLCTSGNLVRGAVVVATGNVATYAYDNSDAQHSLLGFLGSRRHFQHWFRDPMGGGALFNTSNAVCWEVR